jgi:hypothetical protein
MEMASDAAAELSLPEEQVGFLRRCNARLDIQSADYEGNRHLDTDARSITVIASTDLDPQDESVRAVLKVLAELTGGPVLDCMNGGWLFVAR